MEITLKQLKEKYDGVYVIEHTDSRHIKYVVKLFAMGYIVDVFVYSKDGTMLYHNIKGYDKYSDARKVFNYSCRQAQEEDTFEKIHARFANMVPVKYQDVKKAVEDWIVQNERTFTLGDCQGIASKWENRSLAFDHAYIAACAFENAPEHADFAKRHNFRVDFRID